MKKLSLKNLKLDGNELLQREQLKTVFGGYNGDAGSCSASCGDKPKVTCEGSSCTAEDGHGCSAIGPNGPFRKTCDK